jgi:hypothetical protein
MHEFEYYGQRKEDWFDPEWKILAYSGHMDKWELKETVKSIITKQGLTLEIKDNNKWVVEHPQFNFPVEILFGGTVTNNGKHYALCFHSVSLGIKKNDTRIQKKLYRKIFSLIPPKWRKEAYWRKNGEYVRVYKTNPPPKQKKRRKK